nr:MFS transporter [Bacillus sp. V59.32b]
MKSNRNFRLLMLGQSFANVGDVLYVVSIISVLYKMTASAAVAAFVPFTITSAMFVSSFLMPLFIREYELKKLLLGSQIGKTIILLVLAIFMTSWLHPANYHFLFLLIAGVAFLDGCANPIRQTLIPHYVEDDELLQANGLSETITQLIQMGMWMSGSLLLVVFQQNQLIWCTFGLFAFASLCLSHLKRVEHHAPVQEGKWLQFTVGWKMIKGIPLLKALAQMEFLEAAASTVWIAAILYVFVEEALQEGEQWWGFINGAFFVGLIAGSVLSMRYSFYIEKHRGNFIFVGALFGFIGTLFFGTTSSPLWALLLSSFIGLFGQLKSIPQQTVIQTSISREQLAAVYTSLGMIGTGIFGAGSLLIGVVAHAFGVRFVFFLSALMLALSSLIAYRNRSQFLKKSNYEG